MIALLALALISAESTLPSGVTLIHVERKAPWSSFAIALPLGSDADPPGKAGLARVAGLAIEETIRALAAEEIPRAFEQLGGSIAVRTGPTASLLFGGAPADRFDEAMAIVFRALAHPIADEKAAIARAILERRSAANDPLQLARIEARRGLFGFAPPDGEVGDLSTITRAELDQLLKERIKAESIVLAATGDVAHAAEWTQPIARGRAPASKKTTPTRGRGRRVIVVDHLGDDDALIVIARPLTPPSEEKYPAMLAAAASIDVLGSRTELDPALGLASIAVHAPKDAIAKTAKSALGALDKSRHGPSLETIAAAKKRAATRAEVALADPSTQALAAAATKVQGRSTASREQLSAQILAAGDAEIATLARVLSSGDELAIVVVASATQELVRELAAIPGVRDVSIVSGGDR